MFLPTVLFAQNFDNIIADENISYGSFPDMEDYRIMLFSNDILLFIMKDAIGL
jgi:hypothetical protein